YLGLWQTRSWWAVQDSNNIASHFIPVRISQLPGLTNALIWGRFFMRRARLKAKRAGFSSQ
ncbi:unnamed protein product, partial [Closterium sp. NIES-64]